MLNKYAAKKNCHGINQVLAHTNIKYYCVINNIKYYIK